MIKFTYMLKIHTKQKFQFLINKRKYRSSKHLKDSKAFIEYLNNVDNIYKNIEEYNQNKKRKILIVFDDMIADVLNNERFNSVVLNYLLEIESETLF